MLLRNRYTQEISASGTIASYRTIKCQAIETEKKKRPSGPSTKVVRLAYEGLMHRVWHRSRVIWTTAY